MSSFITKFKRLLKTVVKSILPIFVFTEVGALDNKPVTVIYAGYSRVKKIYFSKYFFGEKTFTSKFIGFDWFLSVRKNRRVNKYNPDVIFIEINPKTVHYFLEQDGYVTPEWVGVEINLEESMDIMKKKLGSNFLDVERLIRKHNLSYTTSQSPADFDSFFFKMHLPYMKHRHSKGSFFPRYHEFKSESKSAFLILIHQDKDSSVGGGFLLLNADTVTFKFLGIRDGDFKFVQGGVVGALYYYMIIECQKRGFKVVDIGGTHPFLNDGLTKYKLRMNGVFDLKFNDKIDFLSAHFNQDSEYAQQFIKQNPFFYVDKDYNLKLTSEGCKE